METAFDLEAKKALAGVDASRVRSYQIELNVLRENGLLVDLDIAGTSMFSRAASWSELGVMDKTTQARFTKGRKSLIEDGVEKRLKSIETRMRQILDKYSYPTKGFYPYRWIPWTAYQEWRSEMDRLIEEFNSVKAQIIDNLDTYIDQTAKDFEKVARSAWKSLMVQGDYGAVIVDGSIICNTEDEFVDLIVKNAVEKLPSRSEIKTKLTADYSIALVYGEQDIMADRLKAEELALEAYIQKEKAEAAKQEAYVQAKMLEEQYQHQWHLNQIEQQQKEIALEAMRQAEIEHARKRLDEIGSPFADVFMQLRNRMAEDAENMLKSIQKNGFLKGKVAEKGRSLIEFYRLMAVHDDKDLRQLLEQLTAEIGPDGKSKERDSEKISKTLEQLVDLVHLSAEEMVTVSRASFVEI